MSHRVLVASPIIPEEGIALLRSKCQVKVIPAETEEELTQAVQAWQAEAIYTRTEKITGKLLEQCPQLAIIQTNGIGVDHIDVEAASRYGRLVLNVPDVTPVSVAEHAIAMILALSRRLKMVHRQALEGGMPYPYPAEFRLQREIEGKTLLIIGLGNIGRRVAQKAQALDLNVIAYDPYCSGEDMAAWGAVKADHLPEALSQADYVSLHIPLSSDTRHIIGARQLSMMKNDAYLINVSRGGLVDEAALVQALEKGAIAGAGLDVFSEEPLPADSPLLSFENVVLSPHCAGTTVGCNVQAALRAAQSILDALAQKKLDTLVNRRQLVQAGQLPPWC